MNLSITTAVAVDSGDIAALVNHAYRPAPAMGGWTHEADWVRGPRVSQAQLLALMQGRSVILLMRDGRELVACVHVSPGEASASIGMLATDPALQGMGLGHRMLASAEQYAVAHFEARRVCIDVLARRTELVAFYERRGFVATGAVADYPLEAGVGVPRVDGLKVVRMAKDVSGRASACSPGG